MRKTLNIDSKISMGMRSATIRFSAGRLIPALLGLATMPIVARVLGPEDYGKVALAAAAVTITAALTFGWIEPLTIRELVESRPQGTFLRDSWGLIACLTGLLTVLLIAAWLGGASPLVIVGVALVVPMGLLGLCVGAARADGHAGAFVSVASAGLGGRALGGTMATLLGLGAVGYMGGWLFVVVLVAAVAMVRADLLPRNGLHWPQPSFLRYAAPVSGVAGMSIALQLMDRLVLQWYVTTAAVALYVLAYTVSEFAVSLTNSILHARTFPRLLMAWGPDVGPRERRDFSLALALSTVVPLLMLPTLIEWGPDAVRIISGDGYSRISPTVMAMVAAGLSFNGAAQWLSIELQHSRRTGTWLLVLLLAVVVNATSIALLAPSLGLAAGAIGTLLSYAVVCFSLLALSSRTMGNLVTRAWIPSWTSGLISLACYLGLRTADLQVPGVVLGILVSIFAFYAFSRKLLPHDYS